LILSDPRMQKQSYRTTTYWQQYQRFSPLHARVDATNAPGEEWLHWRGADIHLDRYRRDDAPLTVILAHGGGGYGRLFAPLALLLHKAGYEVIAPDLPGYGLSDAPSELIRYDAWVDLLADIAATERQRSGRRIVLFGGSLGGYLAYLCAAKMPRGAIAGVIATTLADPRMELTRQQFARNALVRHGLMPLMPAFAALAGRLRLPVKWFTKMHAMSNDRTLARLVAADPCGGGARVPVGFMASIFTVRPDVEPEHFDACPVLLAHPAADRWTSIASSRPFFDRIKGSKELVLLDNCGHFPIEQPGITQLEQAAVVFLQGIAAEAGPAG
jgi:alpha-beta hydrolase superfamily lysophospholipase